MNNNPIRVAIVLNRFDSGGIESIVTNYYKYFDKEKVQCDFYYDKSSTVPVYDELKAMGAGMYPMPPYTDVVNYYKEHIKAFRERKYRIVHAHVSAMSVFSLVAAKKAGVPVRICHDHTVTDFSEGLKAIFKYILRPFNPIPATDYFACGEKAAKWMFGRKAFSEKKVTIMTNAIEASKFAFSQNNRKSIRYELNIPQDAFVIGHVGRFSPDKNHEFLLRVFNDLKKKRPDAVLLCVGEGELLDRIKEKAPADSVFAGVRKDVYKIYSAMDAFVFPSYVEGLPVTLVEAQCNGIQCFCSDTVTKETDITGTSVYLSIDSDPAVWVEKIINAKRYQPEIPEKWNAETASKWLENWYISNNGYSSAYLRNSEEGPACYYRFGQYVKDLSTGDEAVRIKINNAYSAKQYRKNFDISLPFVRKIYQAYLFTVLCFNRFIQLRYDLKYKPDHIVIQRELFPKYMPAFLGKMEEKLDSIIWDFDDDITIDSECSKREFQLLKEKSEVIIVTNTYLNKLVGNKAILMPTTDGFAKELDIESIIENRKKSFYDDFKTIWVGSFSNLPNLDIVDIPKLRVICNRPYNGNVVNIRWTRETAQNEMLNAHAGIMPLLNEPYNQGKGAFKIIQYMSVGLPVFVSSVGYNKEVVNEEFGFFDTFDISEVSSDIQLWEKMSRKAYETFKNKYSYESNLKKWKKLLK